MIIMKIGIPRTLTYYAYLPLWRAFFEYLDYEMIFSNKTSKSILDKGVKFAVNDACIPIKLFHGHVYDLKDKADFIFIPRLLNLTGEKSVTYCPKFLGLADMIKASMPDLPPILDFRIDLRENRSKRNQEYKRLAALLKENPKNISRAFRWGQKQMLRHQKYISKEQEPEKILKLLTGEDYSPELSSQPITLAIVGYPYLLYDDFINVGLISKLYRMDVRILTTEMVPEKTLKMQGKHLPKDLFWTFSNEAVRGSLYYIGGNKIDGIIHITAFGCGPDSIVGKLIELKAKQKTVPYICISLDEHTGEAGVLTRLEAFVDMLEYRRDAN